jgi:ketosteroid isomerase-like protein
MSNQFKPLLILVGLLSTPVHAASHPPSQSEIASHIKADVAEIVAGINSKDVDKATRFDAPDLVSMESMRPPSVGAKSEREGFAMVFKYSPSWRLSLIDETVDVAKSGDMAVYRSTYNEDSTRDGVPYTHKVNFIAGFRRDPDDMWRMHWSVVCAQSPSQKK